MRHKLFKKTILALSIMLLSISLQAQRSIRDSIISYSSISFNAAFQTPAGDMSERFGNSVTIGGSYHYKTGTNWVFGIEAGYLFGTTVKDRIGTGIRTEDGYILDNQGNYVTLKSYERGLTGILSLGKVLPVIGPNPNSGIYISVGAGILQHKIKIETDNDISQFEGEYLKGYDRLTNGLLLQEIVGYQHRSNNRRINYFIGIEIMEGLTQSRRDYNFDLQKKDDTNRLDLLLGLKLGWSFLIYPSADDKKYYN